MKIGRYRINFGRCLWIQIGTSFPITARRFLFFIWIIKYARPEDVDEKPQFPLGTKMKVGGTTYRYMKAAEPIKPGMRVNQ